MSSVVRSTSTGSPRPCLKHNQSSPPSVSSPAYQEASKISSPMSTKNSSTSTSSRVHFPPTPILSTTFPTHSKSTYDRRPLVVQPNDCAMPERGCPGRTYVLERTRSCPVRELAVAEAALALAPGSQRLVWTRDPGDDILDIVINEDEEESSVHSSRPPSSPPSRSPSAIMLTNLTPRATPTALPSLMPDVGPSSSESEESDALISPNASRFRPTLRPPASPHPNEEERLLFLPHPPSPEVSKPRARDKDKEREREARRRRRREIDEERGMWKTSIPVKGDIAGDCLGGF